MICAELDCVAHYACRLRAKALQVSPKATPNRAQNRTQPYRPHREPSFEKGRAGEYRPDGSFMPILNRSGSPMTLHERMGQRSRVDEGIKRLKSDPHVFAQKGGSG